MLYTPVAMATAPTSDMKSPERGSTTSIAPLSGSRCGRVSDHAASQEGANPRQHPSKAGQTGQRSGRAARPGAEGTAIARQRQRRGKCHQQQAGTDQAHRPLRPRSAAMMASGSAGNPGPSRPRARRPRPVPGPRRPRRRHRSRRAQSPKATTRLGRGHRLVGLDAGGRPCCVSPVRSPAARRHAVARPPAGRRTSPSHRRDRRRSRSRSHTRYTTQHPRDAPESSR